MSNPNIQIRKFEDDLFSREKRWDYALDNAAQDYLLVECGECKINKEQFFKQIKKLYPGYEERHENPKNRIGMLSLFLPIGCNARCPDICFTDIESRKTSERDIGFSQIKELVNQFADLGGKVLRIVGDGEPVLWPELSNLIPYCREKDIKVLMFTNGLMIPKSVIYEYERGDVYFYVKLWSEDYQKQNELVVPKEKFRYRYINGEVGPAPDVFYELYNIDPSRVGFQIMVSALNFNDVQAILSGPKGTGNIKLFIEPFIPEGAGSGNEGAIVSTSLINKGCDNPPRSSYLAIVDSWGRLKAGTFISQGTVSVLPPCSLKDVWKSIFVNSGQFFTSRYSAGCFCELVRVQAQQVTSKLK